LWPRYSARLDELLALPEPERSAWLAGLPEADADLRPGLAAVLAGLPGVTDDFLSGPASFSAANDAPAERAGERIGPYELLRELGRGGMGVVWLARRCDGAFAREVALKLPHAHLLAGPVRERFERERDILAALDHPHIARFFDAGLGADGQPYLALEAVDGQPITAWCREQGLPLAARLALFAQVADAVSHAHGQLIAHRDLKPANVLVTQEGQVKLLDFGIAKLLAPDEGGAMTQTRDLLATPRYAAPEQLAGGPVSVATDIYALGLMLFELLTDQAPPPPGTLRPQPSRAAADPVLRKALSGDLDAIVDRALQTRPQDRYASVAALADDLLRHRQHRPILARHLSAWALAGRYLRRHRLPAALAAALVLALLAGTGGAAWQAHEARAQARRAEAVKDFVLGIFSAADPRLAGGKPNAQTPAKTLLDRIAARIDDGRFAADPELRIELLRTAVDIYRELGEDAAFEQLQARQLALVREHFGPLHDNILDAELEAALRAYLRGDLEGCRRLLNEADAHLRAAGRDQHPLRAQWWTTQAMCLRDQPDQADARLAALTRSEALFAQVAPGQRGHVTALCELATEYNGQLRLSEAAATNRRAIAMSLALPQRNEVELQTLHSNLGMNLMQGGELAAAAESFGRAAEIAERTSGADFATALLPRARQARTLHLSGERVLASALFERLLGQIDHLGPDADSIREDAGERLAAEGRPALGLPLLRQALAGQQARGQFEFAQRRVQRHLADALARLDRHDEALALLQTALQAHEANEPPGRQPSAAARERLGRLLLDMQRPEAAATELQRVIDEAAVKTWSHVALAQAGLARAALMLGDRPAAAQHAQAALDTWARVSGFRDVRMQAYLWRVQAKVLEAAGDTVAAKTLREQALAAARRTDAPHSLSVMDPGYLGL
ncbi:MAG: serine/threonine protein kinase, partial [Paucibacter sp.]|nr:serine/threonine protein kinase [Roseateles sp.]